MADYLDLKLIVKHIANSTLEGNLCIVCLGPLGEQYENIFTKVCKEDKEYCIADVLEKLCHTEFTDADNYNTCIDCFMRASAAYKFFLQAKRSEEIINFYTNELLTNIAPVDLSNENSMNTLCILPVLTIESDFDFNLNGIGKQNRNEPASPQMMNDEPKKSRKRKVKTKNKLDDDNIVMVVNEAGEQMFYKLIDGEVSTLDASDIKKCNKALKSRVPVQKKKQRRKRDPLAITACPKCPARYRFLRRLKGHMKTEHNMKLYICKVCKETTCSEEEYKDHIKTHTGLHECDICNTVFKKCDTLISHQKRHEHMKNLSQAKGAHICEVCGVVLENEEKLSEHNDSKHVKKFTCYYCGKMYRGENSFDMHIKKHEMHMGKEKRKSNQTESKVVAQPEKAKSNKCMCPTCGRYFVDERALLWHQRLHNNERPYSCDVCGRGFVSVNRRNQHAVCAHTAPTRRCPLCPALFHLRSMVNTHIKKVHLKTHKRRYRTSKHQNVFWRTETVPIGELSISIQNEIMELKAAQESEKNWVNNSEEDVDLEQILSK